MKTVTIHDKVKYFTTSQSYIVITNGSIGPTLYFNCFTTCEAAEIWNAIIILVVQMKFVKPNMVGEAQTHGMVEGQERGCFLAPPCCHQRSGTQIC